MLPCFRLYSCLANGSADEFQKGEHLFKAKAVKDALQIGIKSFYFHDIDQIILIFFRLTIINLILYHYKI